MPVNHGLANLSNATLLLAVGKYALAMLGYAGDYAFGTRAIARVRLIRFPALAAPETAAAETAVAETAARPAGADPGTDSGMAGAASGGRMPTGISGRLPDPASGGRQLFVPWISCRG